MLSCTCLHEGRPVITNATGKELSITNSNENVLLVCYVTGDDLAGGYWERLSLLQNLSSMSLFLISGEVKLKINRARPMHSGEYRCVVYSQWGMAYSNNVTVNVTSKYGSNNSILFS